MKKIERIYVAGKYSTNDKGDPANIIEVMDNIRKGQKAALDVLRLGYIPFCPWFDWQFLLLDDEPITIKQFQNYSMSWLEVSDSVYVISGEGNGGGVDAELNRAKELGLPVFRSIDEIIRTGGYI